VVRGSLSTLSVFGLALIASIAALKTDRLEAAGSGNQTFDAPVSGDVLESYRLVKLKRVYFALGKADLSMEDQISLGQFARRFCRMNQIVIELRGYADGAGSTDQDLALSMQRADTIARSLTEGGVLSQRIRLVGLGEIDERGPKDNPEHQRVDIRIFMNPPTTSKYLAPLASSLRYHRD
jgi:outer membrane protein OmpA-like peptidoglycan-associated protein